MSSTFLMEKSVPPDKILAMPMLSCFLLFSYNLQHQNKQLFVVLTLIYSTHVSEQLQLSLYYFVEVTAVHICVFNCQKIKLFCFWFRGQEERSRKVN